MNLKELRKQKDDKKNALDAILAKAEGEKRELNDAENTQATTLSGELRDLDKQIDAALDTIERENAERTEREDREAEIRREERLKLMDRQNDVRNRRRVEETSTGRDSSEIRVHDAFPMMGRKATAFTAVYGDEKRGRAEAYKAGMYLLGSIFGVEECRQWSRDYGYGQEMRVLNNVTPSAGAVLVPDGLVNSIIWNVEQRGIFAQYANSQPMGNNDTVFVPKSTGEVTVYAVAELQTDEVTDSDPTFDGVEIIARTWGASTRIGRNLLDDAVINVAEHVVQKIGYAVADKQDQTGFLGDGSSTYHNIRGLGPKIDDGTHTAGVYTAVSGNTTFGTLDMEDFEAMVGKLPQWAEDDAAWYVSKPGYYASMARLMDAAGGNTQDNVAGGKALQFLGYPVRISQVLNRTLTGNGNNIGGFFGSLRKTAAFGMKKELSIQTLIELYAKYNQIGIIGFSRWGINNHELGDNTNAGAMIALKFPGA